MNRPEDSGSRPDARPDARDVAEVLWLWDQVEAAGGDTTVGLPPAAVTPPDPARRGPPPTSPVGALAAPAAGDDETPRPDGSGRRDSQAGEAGEDPARFVGTSAPRAAAGAAGGPGRPGHLASGDVVNRSAGASREASYESPESPDKPSRVYYVDVDVDLNPLPVVSAQTSMARALRPLAQQVPSGRRDVVDEAATAEGMVDEAAPFPVVREGTERRWEMVLVVDDSKTMSAVWADAVPGLVAFLKQQSAFRDVTVRYLDTDGAYSGGPRLRRSRTDPTPAGPSQLVDHSGRQLVWVVTDGIGRAWQSGEVGGLLSSWGRRSPVAVVDVLPAHAWNRTNLRVERVRLRGPGRSGAAPGGAWEYVDPLVEPEPARDAVAIPVVELDPDSIGRWARFVAAPEPVWTETAAVVARPEPKQPPHADWTYPPWTYPAPTTEERLRDFLAAASPSSRKLASYLAAARLTRESVRLVVEMAAADRRDLSEIISYGLLRTVESRLVDFDFVPGIRDLLLATGIRGDSERVERAVEVHLARNSDGASPGNHAHPRHRPESSDTADERERVVSTTSSGSVEGSDRPGNQLRVTRMTTKSEDGSAMSSRLGDTPSGPSPHPEWTNLKADSDGVVPGGGDSVASGTVAPGAPPAVPGTTTSGRLPAVWGNVPPRNPHFTGREELLEVLHRRLTSGTTTVLPEALHGMGGVGKSQLAIEYVYRHLSDYDVIWWISAERTVQIGTAVVELGQRLGLKVGTEANVAVREVVEALRVGEPYARWLLVFDNAEDPRAVREYFPQGIQGQILVTSRNPSWGNVTNSLEVTVFEREESIQLLRSRGGPLNDEDADLVAAALGDLPLAVEQAATWRAETGMSAQEYLRLFEDKRSELLGTAPADYQLPVTAAWNVSLDRLAQSSPAALELLQVCAFFAPESISRQLLSRGFNEKISPALDEALRDPVKLGQAIREVNRYALARIDHRSNSIVMHRLVQAVLKGRMSEEEQHRMRRGAHLLLAASDPNDPARPDSWNIYADLYPHVIASDAARSPEVRVRKLLVNLVDYLYRWGDHQVSCNLTESTYRTWLATFGEDDPQSLEMATHLGWMLGLVGRYAEAAEVNQRLLDVLTRVYGSDAEQTLEAYGNVVADKRFSGDFEESLRLARQAQQGAVRTLGPDEPVTLSAAHNLGVTLRLLGRFVEAQELDTDTWRRRSQLFGEDDERSLNTLSGLTIDRRELGDYLGAKAAQEDVDVRYRSLFQTAPNNPWRLRSGRYLAVARRKAGDHDGALALSRDVEQRLSNRYGGEHHETMAAALGLSIDLRHAGLLLEARETCTRVHQRYSQAFGENHPHALAAAVNLGVIYRLAGDLDDACELDERTLVVFVDRLGPRHPSTLACATNYASDLYACGQFQEAHDRDVDTFALSTEILGEVHPSTLAAASNLAMDLRALERKDEALRLQTDTVRKLDAVLGLDHRATKQAAAWVRSDCDIDPMPL